MSDISTLTISDFITNVNEGTDAVNQYKSTLNELISGEKKLGEILSSARSKINTFLISGMIEATKVGIDYNASIEKSKIKWTELLGTQEKASDMLNKISKFAASTTFDLSNIGNYIYLKIYLLINNINQR